MSEFQVSWLSVLGFLALCLLVVCIQPQNPEVRYRAQLEQLAQMGFVDRTRNIQGNA